MPVYKCVTVEESEHISTITIANGQKNNKLDIPCMDELSLALQKADGNSECRVVILTAQGEYFCSGGELGDFRLKSPLAIREFGESFIALHTTIIKLKKPVIAAVQGHALGGGFNLVEACDLAVASDEATFGVPEMHAGLAPMMALAGLARVLTRKGVMELALFGDPISADRAKEIGLINWVGKKEEVMRQAIGLSKRLTTASPAAVATCKRLYYEADALNYQRQMECGLSMLVSLLKSEDAAEALQAKEENRDPVWRGK